MKPFPMPLNFDDDTDQEDPRTTLDADELEDWSEACLDEDDARIMRRYVNLSRLD